MAEATYKVVGQRGPSYAAEITEPDGCRRIITPFKREADARAWIAEAKWKAAMSASKSRPRSPKKPD